MANMETVFRKAKELNSKIGGGKPKLPLKTFERQLCLTPEETRRHILDLKNRDLIRFTDSTGLIVELTDLGRKTRL
jgi:hypothetical protein